MTLPESSLKLAQSIAHDLWEKYDDTYGYRTEKQDHNVKVPTSHPDNIWFFWGQFDSDNHLRFGNKLAERASEPGGIELIDWVQHELSRERQAIKELADKGIYL